MRERFETFSLSARLLFFFNYTCLSFFLSVYLSFHFCLSISLMNAKTENAAEVARVAPLNPFVAGIHSNGVHIQFFTGIYNIYFRKRK